MLMLGGNFEGEDFGEDQGFGEEDAGKDLDEEREDFGEDDMKQTPYETPDGRTRRLVVKSKYVPHTPSVGRYNTLIPLVTNLSASNILFTSGSFFLATLY